jgi:hypothetical protein
MARPLAAVAAKQIMGLVAAAAASASRASQAFDELKAQAEAVSLSMGLCGQMYAQLVSTAQSGLSVEEGLAEARATAARTDAAFSGLHHIFHEATDQIDTAVTQLHAARSSWNEIQAEMNDTSW